MADGEAGAEIVLYSNKLDQAKLVFNECVNMRQQSRQIKMLTKSANRIYTFRDNVNIEGDCVGYKTMDEAEPLTFSVWMNFMRRGLKGL